MRAGNQFLDDGYSSASLKIIDRQLASPDGAAVFRGEIVMLPQEPRRILLIDDNQDLLDVLAALLGARGFTTIMARNGLEALEFLENSPPPAVILLDLNMPVMDGREFLARKVEIPKIAAIPVIISTASPEQAPMNLPILRKPFEPQKLIQVVNQYCGTS
jgi:CheY-like chemotaxis protein